MKDADTIRVPLPKIFTGKELMDAFLRAATVEENDSTSWEYIKVACVPGVFVHGHHYFMNCARPVFRNQPNGFQRGVLGRGATWSPRSNPFTIADSEVTVYLLGEFSDEIATEEGILNARMGMHFLGRRGGEHIDTYDLKHPILREFRLGFEMIRANLLTRIIELARKTATDTVEKQDHE